MQTTFVPDDLFDRQTAAANSGVQAVAQTVEGQRLALAAAIQLSLLSIEAAAHFTRSIISTALELTDRATTTSARSVEQLSHTMTAMNGDDEETAANGSRSPRRAKEAAAA